MFESLDDQAAFAVGLMVAFGCALERRDIEDFWALPDYGASGGAPKAPFDFDALLEKGVLQDCHYPIDGATYYQFDRGKFSAAAFRSVLEAGQRALKVDSLIIVRGYLNSHVKMQGYRSIAHLFVEYRRSLIAGYVKGFSEFKAQGSGDYFAWDSRFNGRSVSDGATLRHPEDSAKIREIASREYDALRTGTSVLNPSDQKEALKYILALSVQFGFDADWAFDRILTTFDRDELNACGAYRLGAYAYLRGRHEPLERLLREPAILNSKSHDFLQALLANDRGKIFTLALDEWPVTERPANLFCYRDFPLLVLLFTLAIEQKCATSVIRRILAIFSHINGMRASGFTLEMREPFDSPLLDELNGFFGKGKINKLPIGTRHSFVWNYIVATCAEKFGKDVIENLENESADEILRRVIRRSQKEGWGVPGVTFSRVLCQNAAGGEDVAMRAALEEFIRDEHSIFSEKDAVVTQKWECALAEFETAFKPVREKVAAHRPVKDGRFCWVAYVQQNPYRQLSLAAIGGAFAKARVRGTGFCAMQGVSDKQIIAGEFDAAMSDADRELRALLVKGDVLRAGESKHCCHAPTPEHVLALSKMPNVLVQEQLENNYYYRDALSFDNQKAVPLVLTHEARRVALKMGKDGGVTLSLPFDFKLDETEPAFYRKRKGVYCYVTCSDDFIKAADIIWRYGSGRALFIPAAGIAAFEKVLAQANRDLPIASSGASAQKQGGKPALCESVVRLKYAEGCLSAQGVICLCHKPALTSEPARGLAEKPIVDEKGERQILVRDFAAETNAMAPVCQALAPFNAMRDENYHWHFDGAEEALDALVALKAAAEGERAAFRLEWPEGRKLDISEIVRNNTKITGGETADYWLGMEGTFKLDNGKVLSFIDLIRNFDRREGSYVRLTDDRYLKLSTALARRVEALKVAGVEKGGKLLISPAALPALEKVARDEAADSMLPLPEIVKERIDRIRQAFAESVGEPRGFKGQMRPYQEEGYAWLMRLAACRIGACLADDMGLGKTIQIIALLLAKKKDGTSLVVAPASLTFNWRNELERFTPELRVTLVGQTVGDASVDVAELAKKHDVVITSYGVLTTREEKFASVPWNVMVLDEAQAIKNAITKRAKSVKTLQAKFRVAATGTPIENRLTELWSIFDFLNPGMLGGETRFSRELTVRGEATPRLKRLVKPLILRRLKRDVLTDLPEKEEITIPVLLGEEERTAYEAARINALAKLKSGDPSDKLAILAELTRLRRFCCHPSLVMPEMGVSAKLDALARLLEDLKNNNHRALVFSQFVDYLALVRKMVEERGWTYQYLDGGTSKKERERGVGNFQSGEGDFFLISLKAGGMGLNLTAANYVILLDPWWNPAVENQAADRVHRIGQRLPVTVYRLIAKDTIEEKVVNLHAKKTALAEDVLSGGSSALSAEALLDLLG